MRRLKKGKVVITSWTFSELKPVLERYMQTPEWEAGFEYMSTSARPSLFSDHPGKHWFHKYTEIDGARYILTIMQDAYGVWPIYITIHKRHESSIEEATYLEAIEEAKNSCPGPQ